MNVAGTEIMPVSMEHGRSLYALADVARVLGTKTEVLRKRVQRGLTTRPWMNRKGAMFFSEQQVMGMVVSDRIDE